MRHTEHDMMLPLAPMAGMPSNVLDQSGLRVARRDFGGQWEPSCDANAAYIIKCVNERERLEAALQASTELLRECRVIGEYFPEASENIANQIAANEVAMGGGE